MVRAKTGSQENNKKKKKVLCVMNVKPLRGKLKLLVEEDLIMIQLCVCLGFAGQGTQLQRERERDRRERGKKGVERESSVV